MSQKRKIFTRSSIDRMQGFSVGLNFDSNASKKRPYPYENSYPTIRDADRILRICP